jgi:type IV secretion system protein VirB11
MTSGSYSWHVGVEVRARSPRVSAELPVSWERFESSVPLVAVVQRKNVLVPGGTSAGKPIPINVFMAEATRPARVALIEDAREL